MKRRFRFRLGLWIAAATLLPFATSSDQRDRILDDQVLHEMLRRHEDRRHPAGVPFPHEYFACLFYTHAVVDHVINGQDGEPKILLTSVPTELAGYKLFPNIVHIADGRIWVRTPIPVTTDGWTHVHVSEDGRHLLITMDNIPESSGWETRIVVSDDGGNTWRYGESLRKYVYFDVLRYFAMDEAGIGTAVEHYAGDVGGYDQVGYYIFETSDWGRTWSDRKYEESFDTERFSDVYQTVRSLRAGQYPLKEMALPGFGECQEP